MTRLSFNPVGGFHTAPCYPLESDLDRPFERELRTILQLNNYAYYRRRYHFTHRMRAESRWIGIDNEDGPRQYFRFRYRIRTRIPLNTDYFYANNAAYVSQYSEVHIEFGWDYGTNFFSQNRNYIGLGYRFWDWTRVEIGYLHQYNTRGNNMQVDLSRGPMIYLFMDILSRNKRRCNYSF